MKANVNNGPALRKGVNRVAPALIAIVVTGCGSNPTMLTTNTVFDVKVMFDDICPVSVDQDLIQLDKAAGDKVRWTAYDLATGDKKEIKYEIFFDPFVDGKPLKDPNGDGVIESSPVGPNVPAGVVYKYTVYNANCTAEPPLDPRIRVD